MSSKLKERFIKIIESAFYEINQILGYEYFNKSTIEDRSKEFLSVGLPFVEYLLTKKRGVNLQELENEELDEQKAKGAMLRGLFHGIILNNYNGNSFEEKYKDYRSIALE